MFFTDSREQFFRPLTSKYRGIIVECLQLLYRRLYTALADDGHALRRDQIIDILQEALTRSPMLNGDDGDEAEPAPRSDRERASWVLNQLIDAGWIEAQVDEGTLQSSYHFTRAGRLFSQPFIEMDGSPVRTRHRNTRNTRNALNAFLDAGEVHDLLDAVEYSERIISDFTDIITELEDRKRQLVKEIDLQDLVQRASDEFFDFMDKRFQPDLSVRLSADSVEKHRDDIQQLLRRIRRQGKEWKTEKEQRLRQLLPDQIEPGQSLLWSLLDLVESRLANACDVMVPALRSALRNFTRRADIIIRQLSYLSSQQHNDVVQICQTLNQLPEEEQNTRWEKAADALSTLNIGLIDPAQVTLREGRPRRTVVYEVPSEQPLDESARREIYIQQALDQAFLINDQQTRRYLLEALSEHSSIRTSDLPVDNASDLLAAAHAIEVGASGNQSSEFCFEVRPTGKRVDNLFFHHDEFEIAVTRQAASMTEDRTDDQETP